MAKISQSNPKVEQITTNSPTTKSALQTINSKALKTTKAIKTTKSKLTTSGQHVKTPSKVLTEDNKKIKTSYSVENNIKSNFAKGMIEELKRFPSGLFELNFLENKKQPVEIINKKASIKKTQTTSNKTPVKPSTEKKVSTEDVQVISSVDNNKYKRICTVTNWSQFRAGKAQFQLQYSNTHLCNYILFSSVAITEDSTMTSDEYKLQTIQHNDFGTSKIS